MITLNLPLITKEKITHPVLLVDQAKVMKNIMKMQRVARSFDLLFRPHFKTHQSADIGNWFRSYGIDKITVSSLAMAKYFAANGWNDITIAFLLNPNSISQINSFSADVNLHIVLDSQETMRALIDRIKRPVHVWIKVDCGLNRTGISWEFPAEIASFAHMTGESDLLDFKGILTHAGQSYSARGAEQILHVHAQTHERMLEVKSYLLGHGLRSCLISVGDTPTCSVANDFNGIDEIRPGNFVFYDLSQYYIGSCNKKDIAVALACPVVGKYKQRLQIVIHGGAVHLSKDSLRIDDRTIYGYLTTYTDRQLGEFVDTAPVISISQEHGIVQLDESLFSQINIGDIVLVTPVHSCLTCDLQASYRILDETSTILKKFRTTGEE